MTSSTRKRASTAIIGFSSVVTFLIIFARSFGTWGALRGDESLLLSDAIGRGFSALFDPFGGYLHLAQRAVVTFVSLFPKENFPQFLLLISVVFWLLNLMLLARSVSRVTSTLTPWFYLPFISCLPVLGIELVGDTVHIQVAMFIGIAAVIVLDQLPTRRAWLHAFGLYVLVFGLSSPSIVLVSLALFYRHERPTEGLREGEHRHQLVLRYAIAGLLVQLWATALQDERDLFFSFDNFLTGIRFIVHSVLPQPFRDMYFDSSANGPGTLNTLLQFAVLVLIVGALLRITKQRAENRIFWELLGLAIVASIFYTTISDSYHTGYLAALQIYGTVSALQFLKNSTPQTRAVSFFALVVLAIGSLQSFKPSQASDVFYGGGGWLYTDLVQWDDALLEAGNACEADPSRDVFVATNRVDSYWGVVLNCEDLR